MKILFDYSPAYQKVKTGIPYFVQGIYHELKKQEGIEVVQTLNLKKFFPFQGRVYGFFENRIYRKFFIPLQLFFGKYDIYIESQYMFIPIVKPKNTTVITFVYDIGLVLFDNIQTRRYTKKWRKKFRRSVFNSDVLVTLSKSSKKDILNYLKSINQDEKPLDYIYPSVGFSQLPDSSLNKTQNRMISDPYLLFIGTLEPRKNPLKIVQAFDKYIKENEDGLKLVMAGRKGWLYDDVFEYIQLNNLVDKVIFTGYVSEENKIHLIQNAKAFLLISLYEGFGMTAYEALKYKTPTLVSDIAVFRELYEDNVLYTNPNDVTDIARMMKEVLYYKPAIDVDLFSKYSWEESAEKLLTIAEKAHGQRLSKSV